MGIEERTIVIRIVEKACMEHAVKRGSTYQLALEFAQYALKAIKTGDEDWLDEIIATYRSMGLSDNLMNNIVERLSRLAGGTSE